VKTRRHHNNRGDRQIRNGSTRRQVERIARRLGVPVKSGGWRLQVTFGPGGKGVELSHPDLEPPDVGKK
jgi:hypothetical protein